MQVLVCVPADVIYATLADHWITPDVSQARYVPPPSVELHKAAQVEGSGARVRYPAAYFAPAPHLSRSVIVRYRPSVIGPGRVPGLLSLEVRVRHVKTGVDHCDIHSGSGITLHPCVPRAVEVVDIKVLDFRRCDLPILGHAVHDRRLLINLRPLVLQQHQDSGVRGEAHDVYRAQLQKSRSRQPRQLHAFHQWQAVGSEVLVRCIPVGNENLHLERPIRFLHSIGKPGIDFLFRARTHNRFCPVGL